MTNTTDIRAQLIAVISKIMARKQVELGEITDESPLYQDGIGLDSLDAAELSVTLELLFGRDPYSEGNFVRTFGELARFYDSVLSD